MSSFRRMISILDLFSEEKTVWTTEEINEKLNLSTPTGYRYVRELCEVGLLARLTGGSYILGPKIIELDYQIRLSDPIIFNGIPIMQDLKKITNCDVLLGSMYNNQVLLIHEEQPSETLPNRSIGRGKPLPLFKGTVSKIILAHLSRNQLQKLYESHAKEIASNGLGDNWDQFRSNMSLLRRKGYAIAHGEVDEDKTSISAPILHYNQIRGSIALGMPTERYVLFNQEKLIELIVNAAKKITQLIENGDDFDKIW